MERGISPEGWELAFKKAKMMGSSHYAEPFGGFAVVFTMGATTFAALFGFFLVENNLLDAVDHAGINLNLI